MSTVFDAPCMATPEHIAIVMDGNGRWAKQRFLPRIAGHKKGVDALRDCVQACLLANVRVLTVFAFSSENWHRPAEEVSGLFGLLAKALINEIAQLGKEGVQVHFIGDVGSLPTSLQAQFTQSKADTAHNQRLILNICFNYGGRWDMAQAANQVNQLGLPMTMENLNAHMALSHVSDPDLLIRTGGEQRISNFLLWQCAYTELYFTDALWPDFNAVMLHKSISAFQSRERRFGKTSAQVQKHSVANAYSNSNTDEIAQTPQSKV